MIKQKTNLVKKLLGHFPSFNHNVDKALESYTNLKTSALQPGKFDSRTKEIMALAIAIAANTAECAHFHLKNSLNQELTYEELLEITAVATYMGGAPALASAKAILLRFQQMHPEVEYPQNN